ncbi:MAG: toxin-antitoxin system, antitoxin component, Xre family protein [Chthoniobacteraceae bacterium]
MATAFDPDRVPEALIRKIRSLPRARVAEVEDFVDFIGQRESEIALKRAARDASAPALAHVWSNPEDDAYDAL